MILDDDTFTDWSDALSYPAQIGDVLSSRDLERPRDSKRSFLPRLRKRPTAPSTPEEAVAEARTLCRNGLRIYPRLCLKHVREDWDLPAKEPTAQMAWNNAKHKHAFSGSNVNWERLVPFGAPVFSTNGDATGHVFIAGGYFQKGSAKGRRIFRSNDVRTLGAINAVSLDFFTKVWGHRILGWTHDLNGFWLPLKDD